MADMPDESIVLDDVSKQFGGYQAVQHMSLSVHCGELFGLLGANGAGKTTTIKMMVGLLRPSSGRIRLWGHDIVSDALQAKSAIGYVPDNPNLYGKLTGREMLSFLADMYHVPRDKQRSRIEVLLETFGLVAHGNDLVQSCSRGMTQKLALCGALIHEPKILFLDEPTVGLDPVGARQLKDVMLHLRNEGKTVLLSTHVLEVADALCDRVGIVHEGKLEAVDSPQALRSSTGDEHLEDVFLHLTGKERTDTALQLIKVFEGDGSAP